jgi:hypothetical protein
MITFSPWSWSEMIPNSRKTAWSSVAASSDNLLAASAGKSKVIFTGFQGASGFGRVSEKCFN